MPRQKTPGSPGRTRTCDQPVNSRLLYQLSYRGTGMSIEREAYSSKTLRRKGETFLDVEIFGFIFVG